MYAKCFKRVIDFTLSLIAILILSPVLSILIIVGAIAMRGNPFFVQPRPGKKGKGGKEKIFKLVKFRTMDNRKDRDGNLLPDDVRLNRYGRILRSTSLDELPELFNILVGDMSIVGPRPLYVKYLPYYDDVERKRHDVRPGLTGYAQTHGRNTVNWEERFRMDVEYATKITLLKDVKILVETVLVVLRHDGVVLQGLEDFDEYRKKQQLENTVSTTK